MKSVTKKLIIGYITEVFVFALIVTSVAIFINIIHDTNGEKYSYETTLSTIYTSLSAETIDRGAIAANDGYVISDYEGRIAVFYIDDPYPIRVIDKYISEVSCENASRIRKGIKANGITEVDSVLQNILG